ncbi:MAG: hypothetical protein HPY66_2738 [Firmicutes bacterium]|nr:hypothetical protein [Bacillota bacterium]
MKKPGVVLICITMLGLCGAIASDYYWSVINIGETL